MAARRLVSLRREPHATRRMVVAQGLALGALLYAFTASPAQSQMLGVRAAAVARSPKSVVANAVEEAARRFNIPASWLRVVMRAESHGDANSVSEKGAIGLMQVMPQTYTELRAKHGFGPDPFDPRDNILAGAAYLAEMFDRYGAPGFLAAYNAGPGSYEEHLFSGRPLPDETTDYIARIAPELGLTSIPATEIHAPPDALRSPIFITASVPKMTSESSANGAPKASRAVEKAIPHPLFPVSRNDKLFTREKHSDGSSNASFGAVQSHTGSLFVARITSESTP